MKTTRSSLVILATVILAAAAVAVTTLVSPIRGDHDADGLGDLITRTEAGVLTRYSMNGFTVLSQTNLFNGQPIGPYNLGASSDLDADGFEDLLFDYAGLHYVLLSGTNQAVVPLFGTNSIAPWRAVAGGDFDGDGNGDLLFQYGETGYLALTLMAGLEVASTTYLWDGQDIAPWHPVGAGDFDLDGKSDMVLQAGDDSYYCVVGMDGAEIVYAEYVTVGELTDLSPWKVGAVSDLDGDGTSDLLLTGAHGEKFSLFMSGSSGYAGDYIGGGSTNQPITGTVIGPR